jgi:lipoprotein-anchoring transpeptidase ErfK/SrfK
VSLPESQTEPSATPPTGSPSSLAGAALRGVLTLGLIVLAAIPIVIGISLGSGSVSSAKGGSRYTPIKAPPSTPKTSGLPPGSGALVAYVNRPTAMRTSPHGHAFARVSTRTNFNSPTALSVVAHQPGWLGVVSPQAGNGHVGWIAQSATTLTRVPLELTVSLSAHQVTVIYKGQVIHRYSAAVGRPSAPTPTGRFAVTDLLRTGDPQGPYGCCILALSAYAPHAIADWSGGNRVAIHSTPDSSSIGYSVSHGCVRVSLADGRWLLDHIPPGTPVLIRS